MLHDQLTTSPSTAFQVVVASVAIYLGFLLLVRTTGQRSLANLSLVDLGCVMALGAIVGRTTLLENPTLATGLIALAVLLAMQRVTSLLLRHPRLERILGGAPVVLVRDGLVLADAMRRVRISDEELRAQLRLAGVTALAQVRYVVLERTGQVSVLRDDRGVDPWLVADLEEPTGRTTEPGRP